jgi:hypothetical protein
VGTHVLNITHELNSSKNVGTHVLNFTHEHLSVSCSDSGHLMIEFLVFRMKLEIFNFAEALSCYEA